MAKKRQTTGVPKAKSKTAVPEVNADNQGGKRATATPRSRAEREAAIQRWLLRGTAVIAVIIVVVVAAAILIERVIIPGRAVATVNGEKITVAEFQPRVRLERELDIENINMYLNAYVSYFGDYATAHEQLTQSFPAYATWWSELDIENVADPDPIGLRVLNDMIDDRLIAAKAKELGITITDADIQAQKNDFFGYDPEKIAARELEPTATVEPSVTPTPYVSPTPTSTPTSTPTPEVTQEATVEVTQEATVEATPTYPTAIPSPTASSTEIAEQFSTVVDDFYLQFRRDANLSKADIDAYFERLALHKAVRDAMTPEITTMTLHADVRHILVDTEEEALDILDALEAGESFSDLARASSKDTTSAANGGELGWTPLLEWVQPFADAVRDAEIGKIVGPVKSENGYHIIQVRAREEREITEDQMNNYKEIAFDKWLTTLRDSEETSIETHSVWTSNVPTSPQFVLRQAAQ